MDRFTKCALVTMALIVSIMTVNAYIGFVVGGNTATDDTVNNMAGKATNYNPFTVEAWGLNGEYFGFFTAGAAGGFLVGYILPSVLSNDAVLRRED